MKKVFFGVLLAMADLGTWVMMGLMFLPVGRQLALVFGVAAALFQAVGYYLIMKGGEELPQTQFWYWAGTLSKYLCAYTAAITILDVVQQLGLFTLRLPGLVENILFYITDLGSFFVMYFCVIGLRELQYIARRDLYAVQVNKCFTAWVFVRLLASLISGWLYVIAIGAYVVMLVYYGRAAWAYDKRNDRYEG